MDNESEIILAALTEANQNRTSSTLGGKRASTNVSVQLIASSLNAADGVFKLQDSVDNENWNDISGASITVASGASSNMIRYTAWTSPYLRAVWTKNSVTQGNIKIVASTKG